MSRERPREKRDEMDENIIEAARSYISGLCRKKGYPQPADCIGVPDCRIDHGSHQLLMRDAGLSPDRIAGRILHKIGRSEL